MEKETRRRERWKEKRIERKRRRKKEGEEELWFIINYYEFFILNIFTVFIDFINYSCFSTLIFVSLHFIVNCRPYFYHYFNLVFFYYDYVFIVFLYFVGLIDFYVLSDLVLSFLCNTSVSMTSLCSFIDVSDFSILLILIYLNLVQCVIIFNFNLFNYHF